MSFSRQKPPGVSFGPAYEVSGVPYVSSSMPNEVGSTAVSLTFPFVTRWVEVINTGNEEVHGEFIGMIKLSNRGTEIFKEHFHRLKKIYWNKPFQRAKIFQKAYLTDFIQELVDIGIKVHCVIIESGWKEIDTVEDYKKALVGFNKKFTKS